MINLTPLMRRGRLLVSYYTSAKCIHYPPSHLYHLFIVFVSAIFQFPCLCMSSKSRKNNSPIQFENSPASFLCLPFLIMKGKRCNNVCVIQRPAAQPRLRLLFGNDVNARQNEPVFVVYVYPLHFHLLAHHPKITQKLHRVQMNDVYDCEFCTLISSFSHLTWRYARLDWRMFNKNISNVLFLIVVFRPFPFSSISCKRHSKFHFIIFCLLFRFMHYTNHFTVFGSFFSWAN